MMEGSGHLFVRRPVGRGEVLQRGVGKDDPEAEGGVEGVPLQHADVVRRIGALHEDGEVQARGPAADAHDPHGLLPAALISCAATMRC